jgi:hypothetical protein
MQCSWKDEVNEEKTYQSCGSGFGAGYDVQLVRLRSDFE